MEDDVRAEFEKLKKEIESLKRDNARKDRVLRQLSLQLSKAVKQIKTLKETSSRNTGSLDAVKNVLRNMGR